MAKMKGMDFKALLLNHGEKFGAGFVAVLALTGLATANWSGCKFTEIELSSKAQNTQETWKSPASNAWPQDKQAIFAETPDVVKMAQRMASANEDIELYATRHWNEPLIRVQEKMKAVVVLPPESPEATSVSFPLVMKDDEAVDTVTEETTEPGKTPEKSEPDQELADLFGQANGGAAPGAGIGIGDPGLNGADTDLAYGNAPPGAGGTSGGYSPPGSGGMGMGPGGMGMGPGGMGMGSGGMGMGMGLSGYGDDAYGMGLTTAVEKKVSYRSGVSVRMVFDMRRQTELLAEALHISPVEAGKYVEFVEYQIERKRQVPGAEPWAGQWETLPLQDIAEILEESAAFDLEIVNPQVVRSAITMPLPRRAAGRWVVANASHKRLAEFELSPEEQELIDESNRKLLEEAEKRKAMLPPEKAQTKGFRSYQLASNDVNAALGESGSMGVYSSMLSGPGSSTAETGAPDPNAAKMSKEEKEKMEKLLKSTLASGRLLLVRFMDFTCDRGTSYIYRVRLEMINPNFDAPVDSLEQPELAEQKSIFSDWSEPTPPVYVAAPYRYYSQKVDSKPRATEQAHMSVFYENDTAGTPVMATLRVPVGTRIGGKQLLEVVDLGKNKLENQDVNVKTQDFLTAVSEMPRVPQADFPELKQLFKSIPAGTKIIPDRLTIVDANGAIVNRFSGDTASDGDKPVTEAKDREMAKGILGLYEHLRPQAAEAAAGASPYGGEGGEGSGMGLSGMGMGMGGMGGGMGRGSALSGSGGGRGKSRGRSSGKGSSSGGM